MKRCDNPILSSLKMCKRNFASNWTCLIQVSQNSTWVHNSFNQLESHQEVVSIIPY